MRIFKLSLAAMVIAALTSCGGGAGESEDPADKYVGKWKSSCIPSYPIYLSIRTQTKINSTELAVVTVDERAFTDATCSEKYLDITEPPTYSRITIGPKATFLGQTVDTVTETFATGEVATGYMTSDRKQMLAATTFTNKTLSKWGFASPYTKQ